MGGVALNYYDCKKSSALAIHLWRRIFRRIAIALQGLPEDLTLTNSLGRLVKVCFKQIDDIDAAVKYRGRSFFRPHRPRREGLPNEQGWRHQFKSEGSPLSNHFVFLLSRLLPDDDRTALGSWRLRLLDDMSEEDRLVALADDEHDDDPEEPVGETIPAGSSDTGYSGQEDGRQDDDDEHTGPQLGALDESIHGSEQEDSVLPDVVVEDLSEAEGRVDDEARENPAADSELD